MSCRPSKGILTDTIATVATMVDRLPMIGVWAGGRRAGLGTKATETHLLIRILQN